MQIKNMRPLCTNKLAHKTGVAGRGWEPRQQEEGSPPGPRPSSLEEAEARLGEEERCPGYLPIRRPESGSGPRPVTAATHASQVRKACASGALGVPPTPALPTRSVADSGSSRTAGAHLSPGAPALPRPPSQEARAPAPSLPTPAHHPPAIRQPFQISAGGLPAQ